jgi:hypothetical protein
MDFLASERRRVDAALASGDATHPSRVSCGLGMARAVVMAYLSAGEARDGGRSLPVPLACRVLSLLDMELSVFGGAPHRTLTALHCPLPPDHPVNAGRVVTNAAEVLDKEEPGPQGSISACPVDYIACNPGGLWDGAHSFGAETVPRSAAHAFDGIGTCHIVFDASATLSQRVDASSTTITLLFKLLHATLAQQRALEAQLPGRSGMCRLAASR